MNQRDKIRSQTTIVLGSIVAIIATYFLSTGPFVLLVKIGAICESTAEKLAGTFYAPVEWIVDSDTFWGDAFDRYLELWGN